MFEPIAGFAIAYALTNAIEALPFFLLIKKPFLKKLASLILINSATLPILWLLLPLFFASYIPAFIAAESLVVLAEALLIKILLKLPFKSAFRVAASMNIPSAAIGFALI